MVLFSKGWQVKNLRTIIDIKYLFNQRDSARE